MDTRLRKALNSKSENKDVEFKTNIDTTSRKDWVEIIKDFVAVANSGGGVILFGVDNSGEPTGVDISNILYLDPADITNKIFSYTQCHFSDFDIIPRSKNGYQVAAIIVGASKIPMIFTSPGTYPISHKKQGRAFSVGTIYFRHGAKSEPGTPNDLRETIERRLEDIRHQWMSGVRKVIQAPEGAQLAVVLPSEVKQSSSPQAMPIRIVDNPSAPEYRIINPNTTHPFRQTELLEELHQALPELFFNAYDLFAIRKVFDIEEKLQFFYRPKYGSPQYSDEFMSWVIEKCYNEPNFFPQTREAYKEIRHS